MSLLSRMLRHKSIEQLQGEVGRRSDDRVEVVAGLGADDAVVASGLGFLDDGDQVRVISVAAAAKAGGP